MFGKILAEYDPTCIEEFSAKEVSVAVPSSSRGPGAVKLKPFLVEVCDRAGVADMMLDDDEEALARADCAVIVYRLGDVASYERAIHLLAHAKLLVCPAVLIANIMDDNSPLFPHYFSEDASASCPCPRRSMVLDTPHYTCSIIAPSCRNAELAFSEAAQLAVIQNCKPSRLKSFIKRIKNTIFRPVSPGLSVVVSKHSSPSQSSSSILSGPSS